MGWCVNKIPWLIVISLLKLQSLGYNYGIPTVYPIFGQTQIFFESDHKEWIY